MGYMKEAVGEAFNLAAGREIRIIDLANMVNRLTGNTAELKYLQRRKWDTKPRLLASNEKAGKVLGFKPNLDFEFGVKEAIGWFKENWNQIERSALFGPGASSAVRPAK